MSEHLDSPAPVRAGEELPLDRLEAYLKQHMPNTTEALAVDQFPHGHSNLTYLLRLGDTELVLRRPPFGNQVKTAHDMGREFKVLSRLAPVLTTAPRPYFLCADEGVLGSPFYIMERRRGIVLRGHGPSGLSIDPETMRQLSVALLDNLVLLHAVDYQAVGLGDLGKPDGYVERQVTGWINRLIAARTDDLPELERVAKWLTEHVPCESGATVIHNDYKHDNLLLDPADLTRIVAVLDWEIATVGDPLMDLGTTLGYWVEASDPPALRQAALGPTTLPGNLSRRELLERYQEKTGRSVREPLFYYCFGLFKIAVIVQQIYARFVRGHTRDARFGRLNALVAALAQQADRSLTQGKL
jgi:aminoglycoside phosphotransferase (APT) family kinase protein